VGDLDQLRSLLGIACIVGLGFAASENRGAIRWRLVLSGLALQLVFAVLVLKTEPGIWFFERLAAGVNHLMGFAERGSTFVFGDLAKPDGRAGFVFAFRVLPSVIFVGALMSVLYHLGIMQRVVQAFSWVMVTVMRTSGAESLAAAANVFVGQTEAPLVVRPYVAHMTRSELMALMVGGFATIAGGVLVAYVSMGISASHLLAASVMSAPAALVVAKLLVPETERPATLGKTYVPIERASANVIDAAASGASDGVKLAINVAGMLIAFLALVATLDALLGGLGSIFGVELTLERILGVVFSPLAFAIGVPVKDCVSFGGLIGTQISLNEFVAYVRLRDLTSSTLDGAGFSPRAAMLATYSLCAFANFGSIGIQLGGIGALAEARRADLARLGLKAMLGGILASNMTASIAGVLVTNAEADFRHARVVAARRLAEGDLEGTRRIFDDVAERHGGGQWGRRAAESAARVEGWRSELNTGARTLVDIQREKP